MKRMRNRFIDNKDLPDSLIDTVSAESCFIINHLEKYGSNVAVNIIYHTLIKLIYVGIADKKLREEAFKSLEEGRRITYRAWDEREDDEEKA